MKLNEASLVELQQRRAGIIANLGECLKEKDSDEVRVVMRGLEAEQRDISAEIDRREGRNADEGAAARRGFHASDEGRGTGEYETGAMLKPSESVRSYMQDKGLIHQPDFADLRLGGLMRSMVTGARTDLERRALSEGSDSAGGVSVPDVTLARFIDTLRAAMVCVQAGAQTVALTSEKSTIARTASDPVAQWRDENANVDEDEPTFEGVVLQARSLAVLVKVSRELVEDSLNIEQALQSSLQGALSVELDRVALLGSGTPPEPKGILNTASVNSYPTSGPFANYDPLISGMALNWADNSPVTSAIIMSPTNLASLAMLKEANTLAPLRKPDVLQNVPMMMTTSMNDDVAILGDFSKLIFGIRTQLRIEVLRELFAGNLQYGFIAHLRADIGVEHPQSFCVVSNLTSS